MVVFTNHRRGENARARRVDGSGLLRRKTSKPLDSPLRLQESMHRPETRTQQRQQSLPKTAAEAVEAVRGEPRENLVARGTPHENPGRRPKNRGSGVGFFLCGWRVVAGTYRLGLVSNDAHGTIPMATLAPQ